MRELKAYTRPILRWWWLVVLAAALAGLSAWLLVGLRPSVYVVSGRLMVGSATQDLNPEANELSLGRGLALTYAKIAEDGSVPNNTKQVLGLEVLPEYSVLVETDSVILRVIVTDQDPARAYAVAQEMVNQIVMLSPGGQESAQRDSFVQQQLTKLEASITETEAEINTLQVELSAALTAREIRQVEEQISAQRNKLSTLQANYVGLLANTTGGSVNSITVIDPPVMPVRPEEGNDLLLILIAAAAGAALALAAAYLLEFLDDRLIDVEQVREVTGLLTLGTVPASEIEEGINPLTIVNEPHTPAAEAFRVLRTNLLFASVDRPLHVLQVTSATVEEGKSYISANLAAAFALTGKRVILVDADLRKPTQHRIYGVLNNVGVTTALVGNISSIEDILQPTRVPSLRVIASGPLPPNPAELISSLRMRDFLAAIRPLCDLVVIDSPPVTLVSDSAMLATQTDGVLLVFSAPTVRRDPARNTVNALRQVKAPILGIALNRANSEKLGYYYTHSDSYGSHYYQGAYRHTPPTIVPPSVTPAPAMAATANGSEGRNGSDGRNGKTQAPQPVERRSPLTAGVQRAMRSMRPDAPPPAEAQNHAAPAQNHAAPAQNHAAPAQNHAAPAQAPAAGPTPAPVVNLAQAHAATQQNAAMQQNAAAQQNAAKRTGKNMGSQASVTPALPATDAREGAEPLLGAQG